MIDPRRWHPNVRWLAIRIAALPLIFVVASFLSFFLVFGPWSPDPVPQIAGQAATQEQLQSIRDELGLGGPWYVDYWEWLVDAASGDLGFSLVSGENAGAVARDHASPTAEMVAISVAVAGLVGYLIASARAARPGFWRWLGFGAMSVLGALPAFVALVLLLILPAAHLDYSVPLGTDSWTESPWRMARLFVPPSIVIGLTIAPVCARTVASAHADRASATASALVAALAGALPWAIGGSILAEQIFAIDGLGFLFFRSAIVRHLFVLHLLLVTFVVASLWLQLFASGGSYSHPAGPLGSSKQLRLILGASALALGVLGILALAGSVFAPSARDLHVDARFLAPSWDHIFGTNRLGQDMFGRVVVALGISMRFALVVVTLGVLPGHLARWAMSQTSARLEEGLARVAVGLLAVPLLPLVLAIAALWLDEWWAVSGAVAAYGFLAGFRAPCQSATPRTQYGTRALFIRQIVMTAPTALGVAAVSVFLHATLGFLRLGPESLPTPNLGWEIASGTQDYADHRHLFIFPAIALSLLLLTLSVLADSLSAAIYDGSADGERAPSTTPSPSS